MKLLIAEDDRTFRWTLEAILKKACYEVIGTSNGKEAWEVMQSENPPLLAIVDWMMPEMDGVTFSRQVRECPSLSSVYIILLTGKRQKDDLLIGLKSGADDYIRKPFDREELLARLRAAERIIKLQSLLATKVRELEQSLSTIKILQKI